MTYIFNKNCTEIINNTIVSYSVDGKRVFFKTLFINNTFRINVPSLFSLRGGGA
jgi:hypothetical protein